MAKKNDKPKPKESDDCPKGGGVGAVFDADGELIICPRCDGSGTK